MRLHEFILTNREEILQEWDRFAGSLTPASNTMTVEALRDHADGMLTMIAADLQTEQTDSERSEKSKGNAPRRAASKLTVAEEHGAGRSESGFTVLQVVAEYRALRSTVLHLWAQENREPESTDLRDMTRFNEAIDQSLAEALAEFVTGVETGKDMLVAIIAHDLRTPLSAIHNWATFMRESPGLGEPHRTTSSRLAALAMQTTELVGDLLDFSQSRLRGEIPIDRVETSLAEVIRAVVDKGLGAHPGREIKVDTGDDQVGQWDAGRIDQALTNLVRNALEHGSPDTSVTIELSGDANDVAISIHNYGDPIPAAWLDGIFNPLKARTPRERASALGPHGNLGLGLYIAERIVSAHGGRIDVESTEENGTTFTVHLPRSA